MRLVIGSGGWIRTSDQLINSQLRYHCATPESIIVTYYTIFLSSMQVGIFVFFSFPGAAIHAANLLGREQRHTPAALSTSAGFIATVIGVVVTLPLISTVADHSNLNGSASGLVYLIVMSPVSSFLASV